MKPEMKQTSGQIIGMLINCEFESVMAITDSLMKSDSTEPLFPFLHLCAIGLRDLDFDRIIDTVAFLNTYGRTIKTVESYEKQYGKTSYSMTLTGFAYASHSAFYLLHKKYFSAINTGLTAVRLFQDIKSIDTANADADFFLGFYTYAKSELRKKLWMILFWVPGSKRDGIRLLEHCSRDAQLSSEAAKMVLVDMYIQQIINGKAKKLLDSLFAKYPESRFLLWSQARFFESLKRYHDAAAVYAKLSLSYRDTKYGDYNSLITGLKQLEFLDRAGKSEEKHKAARILLDATRCSKDQRTAKLCKEIEQYTKD